ncbi:DNA glycosylase [Lipomyces japonicus]|uniref:DNA glycosylase n=1 Tax=Lipomyces japonicus TaxID=56871 RepID=UPI0034CDC848
MTTRRQSARLLNQVANDRAVAAATELILIKSTFKVIKRATSSGTGKEILSPPRQRKRIKSAEVDVVEKPVKQNDAVVQEEQVIVKQVERRPATTSEQENVHMVETIQVRQNQIESRFIIPTAYMPGFKFEHAVAHLQSIDHRFEHLFRLHACELFNEQKLALPVDPFASLASSIISQQISGAAAKSIRNKFLSLFDINDYDHNSNESSMFPTPQQVLTRDVSTLRSAGFSQRKAEYLLDLASKFASGEIDPHALNQSSDEQVIQTLTKVRGLGVWSCEMFLLFALKRPDVFAIGDLGVQRGMAVWYGKNIASAKGKKGKFKYMTEQEMIEKSESFKPYRSLFMWYMWRVGDVIVPIASSDEI